MRTIRVPGDKSMSQRALILSVLATGESRLRGVLPSDDPCATAGALRALGADLPSLPGDGSEIRVQGVGLHGLKEPVGVLDFENSGTGSRLMLGVLAAQSFTTRATGDSSLRGRPMGRITRPLAQMGATFHELGEADRLPLEVVGSQLRSLDYDSPVASAQVKSAVLFAGLAGETFVLVSEPRCSRDHTERMFGMVGVSVVSHENGGRWHVELRDPPSSIHPLDFEVPGDFSSASFLVALALLGGVEGGLAIDHVGLNPTRTGFLGVLARMGGRVDLVGAPMVGEPAGGLRATSAILTGTEVGEAEVPGMIDEFPILAVVAARAEGVTRITGASELRVKESDRIRALVDNLRAVGVEVEELEDGLEIVGSDRPLEGAVSSCHDHRIAMAFGILGALPGNRIEVEGSSVVDVSFPGFWTLLADLTSGKGGS